MWLWVDFNAVEDDTIWTSVKRTASVSADDLAEGQRVELRDHEGNSCWGTIVEMRGSIVYLELDWSTWNSAQDKRESKLNFTAGESLTGTFFGNSFEITERFHNPRIKVTTDKKTGKLQPL